MDLALRPTNDHSVSLDKLDLADVVVHGYFRRIEPRGRRATQDHLCLYPRGEHEHAYNAVISWTETEPLLGEEAGWRSYLCRLSGRGYLWSFWGQNGHT